MMRWYLEAFWIFISGDVYAVFCRYYMFIENELLAIHMSAILHECF